MPSAASGEARAASGPEGYADLPLFYYPGYRAVSADGGQLPVIRSEDGLARVLFAGEARGGTHVFYRERRLWRLCEIISVGTLALFAVLFMRGGGKKKGKFILRPRPSDVML